MDKLKAVQCLLLVVILLEEDFVDAEGPLEPLLLEIIIDAKEGLQCFQEVLHSVVVSIVDLLDKDLGYLSRKSSIIFAQASQTLAEVLRCLLRAEHDFEQLLIHH